MTLEYYDDRLFWLNQKISLNLIFPRNLVSEKNKFFKNENYNPQFRYNDLTALKNLKLDRRKISSSDKVLSNIFSEAVKENNIKLDMYASLGKNSFFKYSENLFGKPSKKLVDSAFDIVNSSRRVNANVHKGVSSSEALFYFRNELRRLGFNWKVIEKDIIANAIVNPVKKTMTIKKGAMFSRRQIKSLIAHEIYGHILRSECGLKQPFKLFSYGLPDYESTEEGLAIYNEELRGSLLQSSLRGYAGRVLAVYHASRGSFSECYDELRKYFGGPMAWTMTLRAKRGLSDTEIPGAFTKDHLYLKGYFKVKDHVIENGISELYFGKVALGHINLLNGCTRDENCDDRIKHPEVIFNKIFKSNVHPFEKLVK